MADDYPGATKRSATASGFEDGDGSVKRFRQGEGPHVEIRLLIHSKNAGAVIGKSGSNIKRLRASYNASITLPDSNGPERVMSIHAPLGSILSCLREAVPLFEDYQKFGPQEDFDCDLRLLVHQSQAGCVIGTKGLKIRELRDTTGSNIKVYTECCPNSTDRVIQIQGVVSRVIAAIGEIYDLLQTAPPKGPVNNYDPASLSQGDFDSPRGGNQSNFRGPSGDRQSRGGRGRGGGNRGSIGGGGFGGHQGSFDGPEMGGLNSGGFGGGRGFRGPPLLGGDHGPSTTTKVSIPKDLAGAIIGKAGGRIKQIRAESMADIRIAEAETGSGDRVITIVGNHDQIQNAQYLLQLSVKEHQGRKKY